MVCDGPKWLRNNLRSYDGLSEMEPKFSVGAITIFILSMRLLVYALNIMEVCYI